MAYPIKRYPNRKLYDPQESRYVTLEELEALIRSGEEIVVTDTRTGEDVTAIVLTQILLEKERTGTAPLPAAFLQQLIRHGEAWQAFVQKSLSASLEGIITSRRELDRVFREWAARAGLGPAESPPVSRKAGRTPAAGGDLQKEVAALKRQMAALERKLSAKRKR